jgi:PAS domain-containing protein
MLRKSHQDHALAFTCDADGGTPEILHDAHGFLDGAGQDGILPFLTGEARTEFLRFLSEVRDQGHSMRKKVALSRNGREFPFSLFGIAKDERSCIIAVQSPRQIFLIYDEFMSMINEQARSLREEQRKSARAGARLRAEDKGLLDDYMRLNNEMANMQRELSIANQALQIQEKRFRDLVTFNPDAQIVLDDAGRILFCNPAAERILSLDGKESIGSVFALDMRGEREFCLKSAGIRTWVEIRHTDVTWEGRPAILFSLRDITERKQMEQIKDDVGRILQHDLVSPLNPIVSLPQLLMDDENITADQKRILDMISKAVTQSLQDGAGQLRVHARARGPGDDLQGHPGRPVRTHPGAESARAHRHGRPPHHAAGDLLGHGRAQSVLLHVLQSRPQRHRGVPPGRDGNHRTRPQRPGPRGHPQRGRRARGDPRDILREIRDLRQNAGNRARNLLRTTHRPDPRRRHPHGDLRG